MIMISQRGDGDASIISGITACAVSMVVLAAIFVSMRFYTRWIIVNKVFVEDWLILAALVYSIGHTVAVCLRKLKDEIPLP
jgi:hypothetical protein